MAFGDSLLRTIHATEMSMPQEDTPWDARILDKMKPGAVTFAWDDGEISTIEAPEHVLDTLRSAWEWIDPKMRELEQQRGRPRVICFRLTSGEFRGLKFPDWRPGEL